MGDVIGPTAQVVVGIIALVAAIGGAGIAGRWNARTKQVEATTPTYAEMAARLDKLEKDVDEEREKRTQMRRREEPVNAHAY